MEKAHMQVPRVKLGNQGLEVKLAAFTIKPK